MRVLLTGSRSIEDTYIVDVLVDGLARQLAGGERLTIITGDRKGVEAAVRSAVEGRHPNAQLMVFDGHIPKLRRKNMVKIGDPHAVYVIADNMDDSDPVIVWLVRSIEAGKRTYVVSPVTDLPSRRLT